MTGSGNGGENPSLNGDIFPLNHQSLRKIPRVETFDQKGNQTTFLNTQ